MCKGVDFGGANVDHVIIFDFPKDPAEYIRRVGRTARAGRTGLCTVFAYGWQLPIARQIMGKKLVEKNNIDSSEGGNRYDIFSGSSSSSSSKENENATDLVYSSSSSNLDLGEQQKKSTGTSHRKLLHSNNQNLLAGNIASGKLWKNRTYSQLDESDY